MWSKCFVLLVVVGVVFGRTTSGSQNAIHHEDQGSPRQHEEPTSYLGDLRYAYKVYQECSATDLTSCLKLKLVAALDRAARAYSDLPIFEGLTFVKDPKAPEVETKSEAELEANLPRSLNERDSALNNLIADKVSNFFESHSLQIKLPNANDLQRSFSGVEEARKKKKGGGLLLLPLILGGTLIPLALGALALLAGKALIVSKLALVLAGIIGLKKLLSSGHGGGHESGHVEVVGGHGSGWGRSYEKEQAAAAQAMAYQAYAPKTR